MRGELPPSARELLLQRARALVDELSTSPKDLGHVGRQASSALALLRLQGWQGLQKALDPTVAVATGATAKHWRSFRAVAPPFLDEAYKAHGEPGVAYLLGWVRRLTIVRTNQPTRAPTDPDPNISHHPRWPSR